MALSAKLSIAIPAEIREKLEGIAEQEDRNLSWVVRKALESYVSCYYDLDDIEGTIEE